MNRVRQKLHAEEAYRRGLTGKGINVAILDTGICRHPDFGDRILGFYDFVNRKNSIYDDASHGTHVAGILGGSGRSSGGIYRGIAPECGLISLKVLDQWGQGKLEHLLAALEWVKNHHSEYGIRILNISAGTTKEEGDRDSFRLVRCVEEVWNAGVTVIVAAGNQGPESESITVPGNSRKVITVGSADGFSRRPRWGNASYSGCGPTQACICKPEFVVPGTEIVSCHSNWQRGRCYAVKSGTSMAAPAVAGCAALVLQQEPDLSNIQVKMRLKSCAVDLGLPRNRQGWGMPDLRRLIDFV